MATGIYSEAKNSGAEVLQRTFRSGDFGADGWERKFCSGRFGAEVLQRTFRSGHFGSNPRTTPGQPPHQGIRPAGRNAIFL